MYCQYRWYSLTFRALALCQRETEKPGSAPTFLYFDLYSIHCIYLYSAYAAHYVYIIYIYVWIYVGENGTSYFKT